jgi:uncharacterized membrane protein YphA (DoxX/SURF4 family)
MYRGEGVFPEPIHGTVEVDQSVYQPNETVIMPTESGMDDRRAARARALGEVDPGADVIAAPRQFAAPSVYRAWPSFVLFIFRFVIASIVATRATQEMLNFAQLKALWATSILPSPEIVALSQIIIECLIALMLVLGLGSRAAGLLLAGVFATILCFLVWGAVNPFASGVVGFRGEFELVMAATGFALAGIGGGGAAVDGAIHRARLERKNARLS